jgi:hypothetical protein
MTKMFTKWELSTTEAQAHSATISQLLVAKHAERTQISKRKSWTRDEIASAQLRIDAEISALIVARAVFDAPAGKTAIVIKPDDKITRASQPPLRGVTGGTSHG